MSTQILPFALPIAVGGYSAASDCSALISSRNVTFPKTTASSTTIAVFATSDTTIAAGTITGTFDVLDPSTWPNAGVGVQYIGQVTGGASLPGAFGQELKIGDDVTLPSAIFLRVAGTAVSNVLVAGETGASGGTAANVTGSAVAITGTTSITETAPTIAETASTSLTLASPLIALNATNGSGAAAAARTVAGTSVATTSDAVSASAGSASGNLTVTGTTTANANRTATGGTGNASCTSTATSTSGNAFCTSSATSTSGTASGNSTASGTSATNDRSATGTAGTATCNSAATATGAAATCNSDATGATGSSSRVQATTTGSAVAAVTALTVVPGGGRIQLATSTGGAATVALNVDETQGVCVGPGLPNGKAAFEVQSTTRGLLFPRMTTAQKNAITAPPAGLAVYDSTLNKICIYTGAAWETITSV